MSFTIDTFIAPLCEEQIEILYEDSSLLMINKPSGLLSLSGRNPLNLDSVHYRLMKDYPTAALVHRLDFGTSGIMLVALSKEVNANLCKQFAARTVAKSYVAFLDGNIDSEEGIIDFPIAKGDFPLQKICSVDGKMAHTYFRVIERFTSPAITKVEFIPQSGRTHQLRIHSREIGHGILGCDLYSSKDAFEMADRLMLHAYRIEFDHPVTGDRIKAVSELAPFSYVSEKVCF
ncbi:MAG: tRNA pseudouridine32 synthase/23S rRNA pseudouridine746 synthase [Oleiphilaceae bacterium]|jgi:tRNA pseudouridine32 synthase/23S rRNA pseudouridine746 synthase